MVMIKNIMIGATKKIVMLQNKNSKLFYVKMNLIIMNVNQI